MIDFPVPVIGIVAFSGTGKTTLLEKLIPCLKKRGLRLAAIKHSHHDFEIDQAGKDSDRLRKAGAEQIVLASQYRTAIIIEGDRKTEPSLEKLLLRLDYQQLDLILVEGFRHVSMPKLEIHRPSLDKPLLCHEDDNILALITDANTQSEVSIPLLPLNDENIVSDFIVNYLKTHPIRQANRH